MAQRRSTQKPLRTPVNKVTTGMLINRCGHEAMVTKVEHKNHPICGPAVYLTHTKNGVIGGMISHPAAHVIEVTLPFSASRIGNLEDVRAFFRWLHRDVGAAFHPETSFTDFDCFSLVVAKDLDETMARCIDVCDEAQVDPCEIGMESHPCGGGPDLHLPK